MGKTSFSGPLYGAKSQLWATYIAAGSSNGATTNTASLGEGYRMVVPPYEDWFVTEGAVQVSTHSSVAHCITLYLKVEGGSTTGVSPRQWGQGSTNAATILTLDQTGTSTTWSTWATAAISAGEYEGTWCPAGSTLRWVSSGTSAPGGMNLQVRGYIRFVDSTRAS